jgi:hypothetical protein
VPAPAIGWSTLAWMEKIMSKTNDTSTLASRDRELRDDELDEVTGGAKTCANGAHIQQATLTVREPRTPVAYFGGIPIF